MIEKIEKVIKKVVGDKKFLVTASEKPEFGHYSTNLAFFVKESPEILAQEILRSAQNDKSGGIFEKVEAKGRFINFWLTHDALVKGVAEAVKPKLKIVRLRQISRSERNSKLKINLEFISANPTGPLTMANGRGGFLGDALANVLEAVGHKVIREYYINDAGNQIKLLGESVLVALGMAPADEKHYQGEYVKDLAEKLKKEILRGVYPELIEWAQDDKKARGNSAEEIGRKAAAILLKQIQKSLKNAGIKFDVWFSEYEKIRGGSPSTPPATGQGSSGTIKKVLKILEEGGLVEDKDGARWLKTSDLEDKDRVLVKSARSTGLGQDGQPTYFLADLAYHYDKLVKRKFNLAIDIWGADHHGYIARLKAGVKALGIEPERLKILITQLVRLTEKGKEVKMSKRTGEFVTMDELIAEVGKDAARFFFLMHAPETHMDFDLALAKEKSMKNPVYYAQYAYVRCLSILRKLKVKSLKFKVADGKNLKKESELNLLRELVKLPDIIWQTAEDYQVSRLARYALEVARALNNFYEKERVIGDDKDLMKARLGLVAATREALSKVLDLLGISKPEKM